MSDNDYISQEEVEAIKSWMKEEGITFSELAKETGEHRTTLTDSLQVCKVRRKIADSIYKRYPYIQDKITGSCLEDKDKITGSSSPPVGQHIVSKNRATTMRPAKDRPPSIPNVDTRIEHHPSLKYNHGPYTDIRGASLFGIVTVEVYEAEKRDRERAKKLGSFK